MQDILIINSIIMFGLLFGSYVDLKKREVPDYLNYSLLAIGLMFAVLNSIFLNSFLPIVFSLSGLLFGFLFGALMFYTGQWGGGDAKMLMGIGALIGLNYKEVFSLFSFNANSFPLLFTIIFTFMFAGSIYGIIYVFVLMFKNWKIVSNELKKKLSNKNTRFFQLISFVVGFICFYFAWQNNFHLIKLGFFILGVGVIFLTELFYIIKIVEQKCMIKIVDVKTITEGEWIVDEIKVDGKYICGPKDLGISNEQIELLKKNKIKKIKIKLGIPFIPGFLIGYIIILIFGNWISQILLGTLF
jgi:prepilin signal peptidase PulO-like enzyme (type II secretory pathway)